MSASAATRMVRLIGRIAEERAARNRAPTTAKPKLARRYTTSVASPPANRGSQAELGSFQIAFETAEPLPKPILHRVRQLTWREYAGNGSFIDHPVGPTYDPIVASLELTKGIDYPDYLAAYSDADQLRTQRTETPALAKQDIDLIDRLFGRGGPGIAPKA